MDYFGIVNLALVTIIYSTFIAPNLKKLGDIKGEISDVEFGMRPSGDSDKDNYKKSISEKSIQVNKKISQYALIYNETRLFLKIFYATLGVVFVVQILIMWYQQTFSVENLTYLSLAFIVIILLAVSVKVFMRSPRKLRTFKWLYDVGITEVHVQDMYNPTLWINYLSSNIQSNKECASIQIASDMHLYDYRVLVTIESVKGDEIYAVATGKISRFTKTSTSYFVSGERKKVTHLLSDVKLKTGIYRARVLIFGAVFTGNNSPVEVIKSFEIDGNNIKMEEIDIDLTKYSKAYTYYADANGQPVSMDFSSELKSSSRFKELLSAKSFMKNFGKINRIVEVVDINGALSKTEFNRKFSNKNLIIKIAKINLIQILTFKSKKQKRMNVTL